MNLYSDQDKTDVNDKKLSLQSEVDDSELEFVSAETVQDIILFIHKNLLKVHFFIHDIMSLSDIKYTMKVFCATLVLFIITFYMSDSLFLMIASNLLIIWPVVYQQKRGEIDSVIGLINHHFDQMISKVPFLMKMNNSGDNKKKME